MLILFWPKSRTYVHKIANSNDGGTLQVSKSHILNNFGRHEYPPHNASKAG